MWLCLAFFPLAVVLFPAGVGERSSGQSHVTPVLNTQTHTLTTNLDFTIGGRQFSLMGLLLSLVPLSLKHKLKLSLRTYSDSRRSRARVQWDVSGNLKLLIVLQLTNEAECNLAFTLI